jgi:hypothetical protein
MVKPEWGTKRTCMSCTSPFYDLNKKPATCPKCGAIFESISSGSKGKKSKVDRTRDLLGADTAILGVDFEDDDISVDDVMIDHADELDDDLDDLSLVDDEEH